MRAGFSQSLITPPLGIRLYGFGERDRTRGAEGVEDDLHVRALWVEEAGVAALVLTFDLLFLERPEVDRLKGQLGRRLGLPAERILCNFSHTHLGPFTGAKVLPLPEQTRDEVYVDQVLEAAGRAAQAARAVARPCTAAFGVGQSSVPVSRRFLNSAGQIEWRPAFANPVLPHLPVLRLADASGAVIALLFSVSCHPTSAKGWRLSAEHPGVAMRLLNERFDTQGAMFLQGCAGDSKARQVADGQPDDTGRVTWRSGTFSDIAAIGKQIASEVESVLRAGLTPVAAVAPRGAITEAHLPLQAAPTRATLEAAAAPTSSDLFRRAWATRQLRHLEHYGVLPETAPVLVHSLTLVAGVELLGIEGEVVSDIGHLVLARRPGRLCFPMGYSNGAGLYIPSERMLPHGGYETDCAWLFGHPAPLAPGFEAVLAQAISAV